MKIRWNPIVKKDLQVTVRSMRLSWGLFAYETVLVMAFLLALAVIQAENDSYYSSGNIYSSLIYLFPVLAVAQVCIVALITPIITASSISGEKERQTFDIMLTTCMSPMAIVFGKVVSAVIRILFFVAAVEQPDLFCAHDHSAVSAVGEHRDLLLCVLPQIHLGGGAVVCILFCTLYSDFCPDDIETAVVGRGYGR